MLTSTQLAALRSAAERETEGSMPISPAVVIALVEEVARIRAALEPVRALSEAGTPGEWTVNGGRLGDYEVVSGVELIADTMDALPHDARLIAAAVNVVRALLREGAQP